MWTLDPPHPLRVPARRVVPQRHFGLRSARGQRCAGDRPPIKVTSAWWALGSTGLCTTFVEGGNGSGGAPSIHACAGRTGRRSKPPPQFGHTFDSTPSTHSRQNVHSYEQIIASLASGASGRLQFSQVGRSSSMPALSPSRGGQFSNRSVAAPQSALEAVSILDAAAVLRQPLSLA